MRKKTRLLINLVNHNLAQVAAGEAKPNIELDNAVHHLLDGDHRKALIPYAKLYAKAGPDDVQESATASAPAGAPKTDYPVAPGVHL